MRARQRQRPRSDLPLKVIVLFACVLVCLVLTVALAYGKRPGPHSGGLLGNKAREDKPIPLPPPPNGSANPVPGFSVEGRPGSPATAGATWSECAEAPEHGQDRRRDKTVLRFATFNVQWLFLKGGYGTVMHCPGKQCPWESLAAARDHVGRIARALDLLRADMYSLQEVEDCGTLGELVRLMDAAGDYQPYLVKGKDMALGQNVALVSKVDISRGLWRSDKQIPFPVPRSTCPAQSNGGRAVGKSGCSKHYIAQFDNIFDKPLLVIGVHLVAAPSDAQKCRQREAQVEALVSELQQHAASKHIIVAGDFNDLDDGVQQALYANLRDLQPISSCLRRLRKALRLRNAMFRSSAPVGLWYTHRYMRQPQLIDHVLVSHELYDRIEDVRVVHEAAGASDHLPLMVTFRTT